MSGWGTEATATAVIGVVTSPIPSPSRIRRQESEAKEVPASAPRRVSSAAVTMRSPVVIMRRGETLCMTRPATPLTSSAAPVIRSIRQAIPSVSRRWTMPK